MTDHDHSPNEPYVLIAEDNSGDVALIRLALEDQGVVHNIVVQTDGEKAMHFLNDVDAGRDPCPALVVLDLNLPKIGGREILARIRESDICGSIPVVVFSSSDSPRDREAAEGLGASLYIRKPSNLEDFLGVGKLLREMLDKPATITG